MKLNFSASRRQLLILQNILVPILNKRKNIAQHLVLGILRIYRFAISPFLGSNCRFYPSCSKYSVEAIEKYGVLKGGLMSIKRISKCHPFHSGGVDLVP